MRNLIATAMVGVALSAFGAPAQAETIKGTSKIGVIFAK